MLRYFFPSFLVLVILLLFADCSGKSGDPAQGNLVEVGGFSEEDGYYFVNPTSISWDGKEHVYVSDPPNSSVYKFDANGKFVSRIGNEGRGPGEFQYQTAIASDSLGVYVQDGNNRMLIFKDSIDSYTINQKEIFLEFEVDREEFIGFSPTAFLGSVQASDDSLIKVFSKDGDLINKFGGFIDYSPEFPIGLSWPFLEVEGDLIHVVFQYFPSYRVYTKEGLLLTEIDLTKVIPGLKEEEEASKNNYTNKRKQGQHTVSFRSMEASGNRIFLIRQGRGVTIDELSYRESKLHYVDTYRLREFSEWHYVKDFFFHEEKQLFYVLENDGHIDRVSIYKTIK